MQQQLSGAGDDLMDAKPSLLALTPVVRCTPVPMQWSLANHMVSLLQNSQQVPSCTVVSLNTKQHACTGKINSFGWLRYSGFVRHKEPHLDAARALADLLVFTLNLTGLDVLAEIESQDTAW